MDLDPLVIALAGRRRVVVAGGPKSGKTFTAAALGIRLGVPVKATDELVRQGRDWSAVSEEAAGWIATPGEWVVEGVATVRALRKWVQAGAPLAEGVAVLWLPSAVVPRSERQEAMARGADTVWREVFPELAARGVTVVHRTAASR